MTPKKRTIAELQEPLFAVADALRQLSSALDATATSDHLPKKLKALHSSLSLIQKNVESVNIPKNIKSNKVANIQKKEKNKNTSIKQEIDASEEEATLESEHLMSESDDDEKEATPEFEHLVSENEDEDQGEEDDVLESDDENNIAAHFLSEDGEDDLKSETVDSNDSDHDQLGSNDNSSDSSSDSSSSSDDDSSDDSDQDELDSE